MDNFKLILLILWGLFFIYLIYEILNYLKYLRHLNKLKSTPLKKSLKQHIKNLPHYKKLSPKQKSLIEYKIQRFLEEKKFKAFYTEMNEEIEVIVSFFACLMTIAYEDYCYEKLIAIYIYPHTIIKDKNLLISGEAVNDIVILTINQIKRDLKTLKRNVIIHEFAHILDFEDGVADGIPPLEEKDIDEWKRTILKTFNILIHSKELFIDSYALTNEAEFFAVISEYFFMQPKKLKLHYPQIYYELKKFYKIDTLSLFKK